MTVPRSGRKRLFFYRRFLGAFLIISLFPSPGFALRSMSSEGIGLEELAQSLSGLEEKRLMPAMSVSAPDVEGHRRIPWKEIPPEAQAVLELLKRPKFRSKLFIMGGFVRDLLLGRAFQDVDLIFSKDYATSDLKTFWKEFIGRPELPGGAPSSVRALIHGKWVRFDVIPGIVEPISGGTSPDQPEFTFNRFVLGFDEQEDPYFLDAAGGFNDLFPQEGPRRGRLSGNFPYQVSLRLVARFLRFAHDSELGLAMDPESVEYMVWLADLFRGVLKGSLAESDLRRLDVTILPDERAELPSIVSEFDTWKKAVPGTGGTRSSGLEERLAGFREGAVEVIHPEALEGLDLRGMLWDCDGTLWLGFPQEFYARFFGKKLGVDLEKDEEKARFLAYYQSIIGLDWESTLERAREKGWAVPQDLKEKDYYRELNEALWKHIRANGLTNPNRYLTKGSESLLSALRGSNVRMAIVTAADYDSRDQVLRELGVRDHFEIIRAGGHKLEDIEAQGKNWGFKPHQLAFIGDHLNDVKAARKAGVLAVVYAQTPEAREQFLKLPPEDQPDVILHGNFLNLDEILKTLLDPRAGLEELTGPQMDRGEFLKFFGALFANLEKGLDVLGNLTQRAAEGAAPPRWELSRDFLLTLVREMELVDPLFELRRTHLLYSDKTGRAHTRHRRTEIEDILKGKRAVQELLVGFIAQDLSSSIEGAISRGRKTLDALDSLKERKQLLARFRQGIPGLSGLPEDELTAGVRWAVAEEIRAVKEDYSKIEGRLRLYVQQIAQEIEVMERAFLQQRISRQQQREAERIKRHARAIERLDGVIVESKSPPRSDAAIVLEYGAAPAILLLDRLKLEHWPILVALVDRKKDKELLLQFAKSHSLGLADRIVVVEEYEGNVQKARDAVSRKLQDLGFVKGAAPLYPVTFYALGPNLFDILFHYLKGMGIEFSSTASEEAFQEAVSLAQNL